MTAEANGPLRVVGLKYEPAEGLPQVILKASGAMAEEVLRKRRYAGHAAPVVRNEALLEQLYRLPVEGRIGPELFRVVAILLAHVLAVEAKTRGEPSA
jgi:type III secretion system FlhB-like substrate exporter